MTSCPWSTFYRPASLTTTGDGTTAAPAQRPHRSVAPFTGLSILPPAYPPGVRSRYPIRAMSSIAHTRPAAPRNSHSQSLFAALACAACIATAAAQPSLRYRLEPGDHLNYERRATSFALDTGQPIASTSARIDIWCFQRRNNEALVLLTVTDATPGSSVPTRGGVLYVDEFGRRRIPAETLIRLDDLQPALDLLPVLPVGAQGPDAWTTAPDAFRRTWRCTTAASEARTGLGMPIDFVIEDELGIAEVLGQSCTGRYWFDPRAGRVTRFESQERDENRGVRTHVFATAGRHTRESAEWADRRTEEAGRFLRTLSYEDALLDELVYPGSPWPRTRARLEQLWAAFQSDVDSRAASPLAPLVEARRQALRITAERLEARAALAERWLGRRAGPWTLQAPDGQTLTSEAARTGVVIECFWTSATAAGLRILEPLRTLQAELPTSEVRVLCYNLDSDPVRSRRAIGRCGAGLRHVLGSPLIELEPFPELPIVRVLDRQAIVRGIWIGWRPNWSAARQLALTLVSQKP